MRVAVVGAGVAGLAAARTLKFLGHDAVVFEESTRVGGRVETLSLDGFVFDTGATSISPRGKSIEKAMLEDLDTADLVEVELPIFVHASLRISAGDPAKNRLKLYVYGSGNSRLPEMLAEGLDVRFECGVETIEKLPRDRFGVLGDRFDAVVLTPPVPIAKQILATIGDTRPMINAWYRSCISVMLGFARILPEHRYHALLDPEQRHPLTRLSLESSKCPNRAPEGCTALVAQLSPEFSRMHFESPDELVISATLNYLERLYGVDWRKPVVSAIRRWRFSQPETTTLFESANGGRGRLIVAGDGVMGARVEYAFESGIAAVRMLLEGK